MEGLIFGILRYLLRQFLESGSLFCKKILRPVIYGL